MDVGALLRKKVPFPFRAHDSDSVKSADPENPLTHLDIKRALEDHAHWMARLKGMIDGTNQEVLDAKTVSASNSCELGAWIYREDAKVLHTHPGYVELRMIHSRFHRLTGQIVEEFSRGNRSSAMDILKGDFRKISDQMQLSLIRLHSEK